MSSEPEVDPVRVLNRIAYLLERSRAQTYRVRAFRNAAASIAQLNRDELQQRAQEGTLHEVPKVGKVTAGIVAEVLAGITPEYLQRLEQEALVALAEGGDGLCGQLRGDLHSHSDWSDGGSPLEEMATAARQLGHEYLALTDHSPRLTVARGLSAQRLVEQGEIVASLNAQLASENESFRLLSGIEVDILADGTLDQTEELLGQLDVVVASVHSTLRDPPEAMTARMLAAVANPHTTVLGHCTGRLVEGKGRPESQFDAEAVFAACAEHQVAVEINSRPERLDPPMRLLRQALELGCLFSIDTDAHAPGQLEWQIYGCARAERAGIPPERILTTWPLNQLTKWLAQRKGH